MFNTLLDYAILAAIGGALGWLASIVMRTNGAQGLILNIIVGIAGALLAGLVIPGGSIVAGITPFSLLVSFGGAVVLLGLVNLLRKGRLR